jgi:hypothetical protein
MNQNQLTKESTDTSLKKKGNKKVVLLILSILIIIFSLALYLTYQYFVSRNKNFDLGIEYSQQDYESVKDRMNLEVKETALETGLLEAEYKEAQEVSLYMTNQEASATAEYVLNILTQYSGSIASVRSSQIKMYDGYGEALIILDLDGTEVNIYAKGTIWKETETTIGGEISEIRILGFPTPQDFVSGIEKSLLEIANIFISQSGDNVRIDKLEVTEQGLYFEGLLPTEVL